MGINYIDVVIFVVLVLSCYWGIRKGFVGALYSFVSIFLSVILIYLLKDSFVDAVASSAVGKAIGEFVTRSYDGIGANECAEAITSIISVIALYFLIGLLLKAFGRVLDALSRLPLIKAINTVAGGGVGIIVGAAWVVFLVNAGIYIPQFVDAVNNSAIVTNFGLLLV